MLSRGHIHVKPHLLERRYSSTCKKHFGSARYTAWLSRDLYDATRFTSGKKILLNSVLDAVQDYRHISFRIETAALNATMSSLPQYTSVYIQLTVQFQKWAPLFIILSLFSLGQWYQLTRRKLQQNHRYSSNLMSDNRLQNGQGNDKAE